MKNQSSSKKSIISIVVVGVVLLVIYFYFTGGSTPSDSGSFDETGLPNSAMVGVNTLSLLNQIQSLRIDTSIFKDAAYKTLTDYSVIIPEVNVGRPNPFAPLPGEPLVTVVQ